MHNWCCFCKRHYYLVNTSFRYNFITRKKVSRQDNRMTSYLIIISSRCQLFWQLPEFPYLDELKIFEGIMISTHLKRDKLNWTLLLWGYTRQYLDFVLREHCWLGLGLYDVPGIESEHARRVPNSSFNIIEEHIRIEIKTIPYKGSNWKYFIDKTIIFLV